MNRKSGRRRALYAAAGVVAAVAGAGVAWWRHTPKAVDESVLAGLWALEFETPMGGRLALRGLRGRPLLINFWATWCPPCVEELPLLDDFYRQNSANGWQVVGLAVDKADPVRAFLARRPLSFPVALAGTPGLELSRKLGNQAGGLPFSVLLGSDGALAQSKIGKLTERDLTLWRTQK